MKKLYLYLLFTTSSLFSITTDARPRKRSNIESKQRKQSLKIWQKKAPKIFMIGIVGLLSLGGGICYGVSLSKKVNPNSKIDSTTNNTFNLQSLLTSSDEIISPKDKKMLEENGSNWDERSDFRGKKILTFKGDLSKCNTPIIKSIKWGEIIYQNSTGSEISEKDVILYKKGDETWDRMSKKQKGRLKKQKGRSKFSPEPSYYKEDIEYLISKDEEVTHLILSTGFNDGILLGGISRPSYSSKRLDDDMENSTLSIKFEIMAPKKLNEGGCRELKATKDRPLMLILNSRKAVIAYNTLIKNPKYHVTAAMHTTF